MQAADLRFADQGFAVGHREANVQVVPVLRLADGANGREVPFQVVGQFGLGNHLVTAEVAADVVPLAATVDDLPAGMKFQGATYTGGVAHLVHQRLAEHQRFVVQRIGRLRTVGGEETIEIALAGKVLVEGLRFGVLRLRQFQAAGLPVAPAVGGGEVLGQATRQLVGIVPARQAQQQAHAPFRHGVVAQFRVVLGHHFQCTAVETSCQGQPDFPSDGHFFITREVHAAGITVEQGHRPVRVLAGETAQAEADHVRHRFVGRGEARRRIEQLRFLCHIDQQATTGGEGGQAIDQAVGQWVVARLGGELGALPALLFGQLAFGGPHAKQSVTGCRLRLAGQPELVGVGVAFGLLVVADLVLRVEAVQFGEIHLGVVVLDEGRPVAAFRQPAQPAQLHPVGLGQVTVLGEEFLDLGIARGLQARGQLVVGQVRFQRIVGQGLAVTEIRTGVALGQGTLGFVVVLALGGQVHRLCGLNGSGRK
ncbi:hypothetical protein D3C76_747500 [compost metagenome]